MRRPSLGTHCGPSPQPWPLDRTWPPETWATSSPRPRAGGHVRSAGKSGLDQSNPISSPRKQRGSSCRSAAEPSARCRSEPGLAPIPATTTPAGSPPPRMPPTFPRLRSPDRWADLSRGFPGSTEEPARPATRLSRPHVSGDHGGRECERGREGPWRRRPVRPWRPLPRFCRCANTKTAGHQTGSSLVLCGPDLVEPHHLHCLHGGEPTATAPPAGRRLPTTTSHSKAAAV